MTANFLKRNLRIFCAAAALSLLFASCDKNVSPSEKEPSVPEVKKNNEALIKSFTFKTVNNPDMAESIDAYISGTNVMFSVPEETPLTKLVPAITCSGGATVTINGQPYTNGTAYDFTNTVNVTVTSESGTNNAVYTVKWEIGDNFIDRYFWKFLDKCKIPGISFSVMKGTKVVYSKGYGVADRNSGEKVTPDHLFRMASISKQFCAMCIMTLKEQGKLKLDDQVFGDKGILNGLYKNITAYHRGITVRHLLSHSSGICAGLDDPAFNNSYRCYDGNSSRPVPTDTLIQRTIDKRQNAYKSGSSTYSPGALYNYSNVGYCILHRIVEVVSGKDYETFLKEEVLSRMGITDTHIGGYQEERRPNECVYYSQGGGNGYANPLRNLAGAAGIITSTNQMMKILTYMDGDDTVPDIFTKETIAEMYTPFKYSASDYNAYGLGWRMNNAKRFFGSHMHGGNLAGTATFWVGGATGDALHSYKEPMSGAIVCNSRSYDDSITWDTSWGSSSGNDIDDSFYIVLGEAFIHFSK